ncbi:hypothetical protein ALTERO38_90144 [Alteromonas sp. 38]|nr:hypothetical protein ALTER154_10303 [Alteromonas sp. 154]VXC49362.1 hypothetical protein ALTERO38_90144 [Alteromonas sp. 38]
MLWRWYFTEFDSENEASGATAAVSACCVVTHADSALSAKQDTAIGRSAVLKEIEAVVNMFIVLA